jgi:N-hydroxyarylamine O-acetyltransferase
LGLNPFESVAFAAPLKFFPDTELPEVRPEDLWKSSGTNEWDSCFVESPDFDHLALRVDLEQIWLADVGFGDGFLEPLLLQLEIEQKQEVGVFRIVDTHASLTVERQPDLSWKTEYRFTLTPRRLQDFTAMCHFHQTSCESHFTQKRICSLAVPNGRITLADLKLITTKNGTRQERILASEEERHAVLEQCFGIVL